MTHALLTDPLNQTGILIFLISVAGLVTALAPILIADSKTRFRLKFIATLLCLTGLGLGIIAASVMVLFNVILFIPAGLLWIAGLLCAIAAAMDNLAEGRAEDHLWRLLNNEAEGLTISRHTRKVLKRLAKTGNAAHNR